MRFDDKFPQADAKLDSWKAIAAFLNRDVRTAMRWEKTEGLPVHRHRHQSGRSVYAYPAELVAWQAARRMEPSAARAAPGRLRALVTAVIAIAVATAAGGSGRFATGEVVDRPLGWPDDPSMTADASISADGRYIAFVDQTANELGVKDLWTGRQRLLTRIGAEGGWVEWSAFSRDSRFIAFASKDAGPRHVTGKLRVLPLDAPAGTPPRVLAEGQWFEPMEWSADNRELLVRVEVNDEQVDIGLVDVATRAYRVLRKFPRFHPGDVLRRSPDGAFVAYDIRSTPAEGHRDIHLLSTTDGSDVTLVDGPSSDTLVGWSPDGAHLLFKSDRRGTVDLFALPVTQGKPSGEPVLVRTGFNFEPRGMTARGDLLYERVVGATGEAPKRALMTATVDPTTGTLLSKPWFAAHDRDAYSRFPRWSADGTEFLYLTRRPDGWVVSFRSIESGQTREMPLRLDYIWTFDWSRDARWLVFRATRATGEARQDGIFLVDAQTGRTDLIAAKSNDIQGLRLPQFTDDGRSITYFRRLLDATGAGGATAFIRFDIATRGEDVLEASAAGLRPGRFAMGRSPDGRYRLAIHNDLKTTPSVLFAYDTATRQEREVFRAERPNAFNYEDGLQWMPDGRAVIVNMRGAAPNAFELWWIPVDGRQPRRIDVGVENLTNNAIAVHPDGRQVAFLAGDPVPSTASSPRREFRLLQRFLPDTTKHDIR